MTTIQTSNAVRSNKSEYLLLFFVSEASLAFSPQGTKLAAGSADGTIRVWDRSTGREVKKLKGHQERVNSLSFSPDGRMLAAGSWNKTVLLWEVATGRQLRRLEGHAHWVDALAFSPDGSYLASGSGDSTILIWDLGYGTMPNSTP